MPHLTIEYSANLSGQTDIAALCHVLHAAMLETGLFELGAIRVRAIACADYAVADLMAQNSFADMVLRIGAGRSLPDRTRAGEVIWTAAVTHLAALFDSPHFALSFSMAEIDPALSWKKNAIHPRLRAT